MKQFYSWLLTGSLLLICAQHSFAQNKIVNGVVYGSNSGGKEEPLVTAIVATIDRQAGTQTAENGSFSLEVPEATQKLVVSFIGYRTDTIAITNDTNGIEIVLQQPRSLKEVVVRTRKKGNEISSLSTMKTEMISSKELLKAACCNLSESFETTPSVDVAFTDAVSGYKQIQMLGLAGPYTLITRENVPDTRGLASITGLTFTPGTWIEGMQLSKGTGSVVNGYEGVAGQINIELKKPFEEKDEKWLFNLYQSSQGRSEANIVTRRQFNEHLSSNLFLHAKSQWLRIDQNNDGYMDQPLDKQFVGANRWFWFGDHGWEVQAGVKGSFIDNVGGQKQY